MCEKLSDSLNLLFTNVMINIMNNDYTRLITKIYVCDIKSINDKENNIILIMKNENNIKLSFISIKGKNTFINIINRFIQ